ncbi:hypothetical protein J4438_00930 [Candidatus Woesearchaeota archaeon]|nr:hypothetical protein [Candidatus Woesearchaeota archaeon]
MGKYDIIHMGMRYKQFFSPNIDGARGTMGLDDAVTDVASFRDILQKISEEVPDRENFRVGLNNCETCLHYSRKITCLGDLTKPKQIIHYFLRELTPEFRPFVIGVDPMNMSDRKHIAEIEAYLNSIGKTLYPKKSDEKDLRSIMGFYDGRIRDLKRN